MTALTTMFNHILGWFFGLVFLLFDFNRETIDFLGIDSDVLEIAFSMVESIVQNGTNIEFFWPPLIIIGIFIIGGIIGLARRLIRG